MTDAAPAILIALEGSAFAAAIRQSPYAYMAANVAHILSLMVFFSAVVVMDLRLAGFFQATWPGATLRRARIVSVLGFIGLLISGFVLFAAEASHIIGNPLFKIKLILILLGLMNVGLFEMLVAAQVRDLQPQAPMPAAARTIGIASLAIWFGVAASGRLIAYF